MHRLFFASAFVTLVTAACSSSDQATQSPPASGVDAGAGRVDFAMFAVAPNGASGYDPVEGASGILDAADGSRVEATSDATGRMVFRAVSFAEGPASITAWADGRVMTTFVGVSPEVIAPFFPRPEFPAGGKDLTMAMPPVEPSRDDLVKLDVSVTGKLSETNRIVVTTSNGVDIADVGTASFRIDVKKDFPLTMLALEASQPTQTSNSYEETKVRWRSVGVPAQSAPGPFALDLANATELPPSLVTLSVVGPPGGTLTAPPAWQVQTEESGFYFVLGSRSKVTAVAGSPNAFETSGEYVSVPSGVTESLQTYAWFVGQDGEVAVVQHRGAPKNGEKLEALAFPKSLSSLAPGEEVPVDTLSPDVERIVVEIVEQRVSRQTLVWTIQSLTAPVPSVVKIPVLPDAARALLPAEPRARLVVTKGMYDASLPFVPTHTAFSRFFDLKK